MTTPSTPLPRRSRRQALRALGAALAGAAWGAPVWPRARASAGVPALQLLGHVSLPAGSRHAGVPIGGLSGLAWHAASDLWYALSDDRSRHAPARCHVLRLAPPVAGQASAPEWLDVITLRDERGQPFARHAVDPEALALRPGPAGGAPTLLWTSEGEVRNRVPPALFESALDGRLLRRLPLPAALREVGRRGRGPLDNETLEGLALTPDGRHAWAAMESALAQDADRLTPGAPPGPCRLTRFDLASGRADRQVAYLPEARPFGPLRPAGHAPSGITEIVALDDERLWVLERAWTLVTGVSARLYEADLRGASDTLTRERLRAGRFRPCAKRLLLDLRSAGLPHVDNLEAMAWGPPLADGRRTLVLCSDDNFNPLQQTQFIWFAAPPG